MTALKLISLLAVVAVGFVVSVYAVGYVVASRGTAAGVVAEDAAPLTDVPDATTQIAFWSKRAAVRPSAYLDLTLLGQAYARKARETSDVGQYTRAEAALRQALRINPKHVPAAASLSGVLVALHDFQGALATARPIVDHPHGIQALATLGDAYLALGQYRRAQSAYGRLLKWSPTAAAYARLAFLADLRGHTDQALRLLERAATLAQESGDGGESLAWYSFQLGEISFRAGRTDVAESHYRSALETLPRYPLALGGLARTHAASGDLAGAIELYRELTAIVPQPDYVAAFGDLYAAVGDSTSARRQYTTVGAIAKLSARQVYNRQLALFYADHGTRLSEARRLALGELRVRKDVYGYDAAAWSLARSGRCAAALPLSRRALRLGTKDALLYFHRGHTEGCVGNRSAMLSWYAQALELNPAFSIRWAPVVRAALRSG